MGAGSTALDRSRTSALASALAAQVPPGGHTTHWFVLQRCGFIHLLLTALTSSALEN
jgi:hypothetical protein